MHVQLGRPKYEAWLKFGRSNCERNKHVLGDELMFGMVVCSDYLRVIRASLCMMRGML